MSFDEVSCVVFASRSVVQALSSGVWENMGLRGIVPAIVPAPPPEPFAAQVIIVDWLYREVDGLAEIKMPVLCF
jgi:hypothetical protein